MNVPKIAGPERDELGWLHRNGTLVSPEGPR